MQVGKYIPVGQGSLLHTSCSSTLKMEVANYGIQFLKNIILNLCNPILLLLVVPPGPVSFKFVALFYCKNNSPSLFRLIMG